MKRLCVILVALTAAVCLFGVACRPSPPASAPKPAPAPWFVDVTAEVGLDFVHDPGPVGNYFLPGLLGGGCAVFDFDGDERLDILLLQNAGPKSKSTNRLYRQTPDGRFADVSAGSGLDYAGYCQGVAIGDVNNDGRPDVLITEYGGARLFLNNGDGTFADVTKEAGLKNPHWGTSAAFLDYDRDGWLDLVIVNYVDYNPAKVCRHASGLPEFCAPSNFPGAPAKLYCNLGTVAVRRVGFEDVSVKSGLAAKPSAGLGVVCADFDGDRWPDIFVANDAKPNHLWINQHDGTFKEEAVQRNVAFNGAGGAEANMGIALGDVDGDGLFDIFIPHLTEETHRLWRQGPRGHFQEQTAAARLMDLAGRSTGFGALFGDLDNDGAPDLVLVNGRVTRGVVGRPVPPEQFWHPYREMNQLYANDGRGHFRDISATNEPLCRVSMVARGLACGDMRNVGALDLLVTRVDGRAHLFRNAVVNRGHWLTVRAVDPALRRDAYGAEVTVRAGERRWVRWLNPAYSYLSSNDPRAHFGLGSAANIDAIAVVWPDGTEEEFPGTPADQALTVTKGTGRAVVTRPAGSR